MPPLDSSEMSLEPAPYDPGRLGVVLFDLPGERFVDVAADLRRLTRKPVQFRWLPTADAEAGRVLVRVESPPPLVVWRVMDEVEPDAPSEGDASLPNPSLESPTKSPHGSPSPSLRASGSGSRRQFAYVEQTPGVWVQLGYRHRPSDQLRPPADRILLIRAPSEVESLRAPAFTEEIETLPLPPMPAAHAAGPTLPQIETRLRLARGDDREPARLWVLRHDALALLAGYCRATHEQLLARFAVAVSASAGVPCVVLRAQSAKGPPPVFVGPAVAYAPLLKLPNLFLPAGTRLAPPLRRDAIRKALLLQSDRVVWLHPTGDGAFVPESLPESAFRPLPEWVEYRVEPARLAKAWAQSFRWEFEPFVEKPEPKPVAVVEPVARPMPRPAPLPPPRRGALARTFGWLKKTLRPPRGLTLPPPPPAEPVEPSIPVEEAVRTALNQGDRLHLARPETVSSALERCHALESRFLKDLPTITADRQPELWAELAAAYDAAGNHPDAAVCWLNALWGQSKPSPLWAWGWLRAEARAARPEVKSIDPGPWLASAPGPGTTRATAAWVVWASLQTPPPTALTERAADLQARLEAHERWLPVRAAWLARTATARLGSDVLGLARTRDRISERLLVNGLSLELDTPSFLRFAGEGVRERFHEARRWLIDKRDLMHQWIERLAGAGRVPSDPLLRRVGLEPDVTHTRAYADLIITWGLTRFAEHTAAESVRKHAAAGLPADDPVHAVLRDAFEFRIAQVRDGKPPRGPLPPGVLDRIEALDGTPRYAVDALREQSRILEPTARVERFQASMYRKAVATAASAASVVNALSADRLNDGVAQLLQTELDRDGRPHLAEVEAAVLDRAFELTADGAEAVLAALPDALAAARDAPPIRTRLIDKGLAAAALWDRPELAKDLAAKFLQMADGRTGWDAAETVTRQAFRSLRRLGLKADADRVLHHVAERVLQGQPIGRRRVTLGAEWPVALRVLLHAAAGWYYAGHDEQAHVVLDEARKDLYAPETGTKDRTELALAYAATLGQAPARVALGRLEEMFQRLTGIAAGGSTNEYYSLKPLILIETAVRAIVSDDFALGPQVRAWLDADELAVRRRVRDELKDVMAAQGL